MEDIKNWRHIFLPYIFALDELTTKITIMAKEVK